MAQATSKAIRVGIIGLSTNSGAWATIAHWPYLSSSPLYQVVAVCNSSLESSQAAIKHFGLPATTKAYSLPEELAQDPNVELYVVSTRVDTHYDLALPGVKAGKNVYTEWPLGSNYAQAQQMGDLARANGCETVVGLQGRVAPTVLAVKSVVDSGRLGDIHSVSYTAAAGVWQDNAVSDRYRYMLDRKVGGTMLTIHGGHILGSLQHAVGPLDFDTVQTMAGNFRTKMKVKDATGNYSDEDFDKSTPDQMMLTARLKRDPPAMLTFHLRAGDKFKDEAAGSWRIYGTKAELRVEFSMSMPHIGPASSFKIFDPKSGEVEDVAIDEGGDRWTSLPLPAQNIGRLYEAFAKEDKTNVGTWDDAVQLHRLIDSFYDNMV